RREREPVTDELHVLRLAVEEGARAALPVRAVLRGVCLFDVEEHAFLRVRRRVLRRSRTLHKERARTTTAEGSTDPVGADRNVWPSGWRRWNSRAPHGSSAGGIVTSSPNSTAGECIASTSRRDSR